MTITAPFNMLLLEEIKQKIIPILNKYSIQKAGIFGSVATGKNTLHSDIDILVELQPTMSLLDFVKIKHELEDILRQKVDLVEYKAIKPRLRNRILNETIEIL